MDLSVSPRSDDVLAVRNGIAADRAAVLRSELELRDIPASPAAVVLASTHLDECGTLPDAAWLRHAALIAEQAPPHGGVAALVGRIDGINALADLLDLDNVDQVPGAASAVFEVLVEYAESAGWMDEAMRRSVLAPALEPVQERLFTRLLRD